MHAGTNVIEVTVFVAVEAHDTEGKLIVHQRHVDHTIITLPERIRSRQAIIDKCGGFELIKVRLFGDDPHRACERA